MIEKSDAAPISRGTRRSGSIEISAPETFTAVGFSSQEQKTGASAPLNAADLLCSRLLTKTEEEETITSTAQANPLIPEAFLF